MILKNNKRIDGCSDTVPIGTLNPFLGSTAPYGYLICQGQKVSKTTYKELYEICGDTFGQSTATEFYLPDLRGQTIAGYKEGDSTFGTLGGLIGSLTNKYTPKGVNTGTTVTLNAVSLSHTGGAVQGHTLTVNEIPSHNHMVYRGTNGTDYYGLTGKEPNGNTPYAVNTTDTGGGASHSHGFTQPSVHSFTPTTKSVIQPTFTGTEENISTLQPSINLNWIVKAFQLMPNQSYVENSLESDSTINSLSAAQGKALNDKIINLSKVAVSGSYNDLINKPTRVDYTNQVTCSYGKLNSNFNYCFLKDGIVYINLSYILSQSLTAGTQYDFAILPTSVRPKGNVVITAFSHKTSHMIGSYIRNTGEIVIVPEKAVPEGKEINIFAEYFIK